MANGLSPIFFGAQDLFMAAFCLWTLSYCLVGLCQKKMALLDIENAENGEAGSLGSGNISKMSEWFPVALFHLLWSVLGFSYTRVS